MRTFIIPILLFVFLTLSSNALLAQGCVAIRGTGTVCTKLSHIETETKGWQLNTGYRYFKSFRHYRGTHEEKARLEQNTEVINWQHTLDLSLMRIFNNRWSVLAGLPILANSRSSLYEHGGQSRHRTESFGIGDARLVAYRWMLNPVKNVRGNFQLGLGIKLPTGEEAYQDYFYNVGPGGTKELRTVDQSIQLGDGATGLITELNGFYNFNPNLGLYTTLYYLTTPQEVNGVKTFRRAANEGIMSVADQYLARLGMNYTLPGVHGLSVLLGGRMEGIPAKDLVGGSEGFRRPGYVISVEPGVNYMAKKWNYFLTVPVALERNRLQSVPDKEATKTTGTLRHGDAAFADYAINAGVSIRF
jgi:hypothetical protein